MPVVTLSIRTETNRAPRRVYFILRKNIDTQEARLSTARGIIRTLLFFVKTVYDDTTRDRMQASVGAMLQPV